jgi:hypothetical protein
MTKHKMLSEQHAKYLADCILDMRFIDKDNLTQYLQTQLSLFYNSCLQDHLIPDLKKSLNILYQENIRLSAERITMEEQILKAKSDLKKRKYVDTDWLARANYAFKMKGLQMQSNLLQIGQINESIKTKRINAQNNEDRVFLESLKKEIFDRFGKDYIKSLFQQVRKNIDSK